MEIEEIEKNSDNKEIILQAVRESGKNLELASEELQDDKEVVMEALKQDGEAFVMRQRNWQVIKRLC